MEEKDYSYTGYNSKLKETAKQLRNNTTREENHLWYDCLKHRKERWHRQRVINRYIADFYCPKAKLVIELDGKQHYYDENKEYDEYRSEIINIYGVEIIRFSNQKIDECFSEVCKAIDEKISSKFSDTKTLLRLKFTVVPLVLRV